LQNDGDDQIRGKGSQRRSAVLTFEGLRRAGKRGDEWGERSGVTRGGGTVPSGIEDANQIGGSLPLQMAAG
jgi:hypothetical protein